MRHGHSGYRVFDEIVSFVATAEENGLFEEASGAGMVLDVAVLLEALAKFHRSRSKLEMPLHPVLAWCANPATPQHSLIEAALQQVDPGYDAMRTLSKLTYCCEHTAQRVTRMLGALYNDGFAAFG